VLSGGYILGPEDRGTSRRNGRRCTNGPRRGPLAQECRYHHDLDNSKPTRSVGPNSRQAQSSVTSRSFGPFSSASRIAACHSPGRYAKLSESSSASWTSRADRRPSRRAAGSRPPSRRCMERTTPHDRPVQATFQARPNASVRRSVPRRRRTSYNRREVWRGDCSLVRASNWATASDWTPGPFAIQRNDCFAPGLSLGARH
jgi:hypothetical protein